MSTHQLPPEQAALDKASREQWRDLMADVFLMSCSRAALRLLVTAGRDEFVRVASKEWAVHALHQDDYHAIFAKLKAADKPMTFHFGRV